MLLVPRNEYGFVCLALHQAESRSYQREMQELRKENERLRKRVKLEVKEESQVKKESSTAVGLSKSKEVRPFPAVSYQASLIDHLPSLA